MDGAGQRGTRAKTLSRNASTIAGRRSVKMSAGGRRSGGGAGRRMTGVVGRGGGAETRGGGGTTTGAGNRTGTRRGGASTRACRITATDCETKGSPPADHFQEKMSCWMQRACSPPQGDSGVSARTFTKSDESPRNPPTQKLIPETPRVELIIEEKN
jgi:hypothetical protein